MKYFSLSIFSIVLMLSIMSCQSNYDYVAQDNADIPHMQWESSYIPMFTYNIQDTGKDYILGFCIRYNNDYPNENLYLFVHTQFPDGQQYTDTVSVDLFYPDGSPTGTGKNIRELNANVSKVKFPQQGTYHIQLEQAMRNSTLNGIVSVGYYIICPPKNEKL